MRWLWLTRAFLSTAHHSKQSEFPSSLADPATTSPDQGDSVPEKRCVPLGYGPYLSTHICPCLSGKNTGLCRRVIHGPSSAGVRDEGSASRFSSLYLIASLPCHFAVLCTWFEGEALNILGFQRRECMGSYYHPPPSITCEWYVVTITQSSVTCEWYVVTIIHPVYHMCMACDYYHPVLYHMCMACGYYHPVLCHVWMVSVLEALYHSHFTKLRRYLSACIAEDLNLVPLLKAWCNGAHLQVRGWWDGRQRQEDGWKLPSQLS